MTFSLVLATYGLDKKVYITRFLNSVLAQKVDVEIIIVDQNTNAAFIHDICEPFRNMLNIIHLKSYPPSLSKARNIGLAKASKDIIAFPDDDCFYTKNLLKNVGTYISDSGIDFISVMAVDDENGKPLPYSPLRKKQKITYQNTYKAITSITLFHKRKFFIKFDEKFGIGGDYPSCEEFDYTISLIKSGAKGIYEPNLKVKHPNFVNNDFQIIKNKIKINSVGHGAYFRKHISLLWLSAVYYLIIAPIGGIIINTVLLKWKKVNIYKTILNSRLKGFINYRL